MWLKEVFAKGISGTLTVFEYSKNEHDGEMVLVIERFVNIDDNQGKI